MARYRPDASPSCRPWQDIAPMRSRRGLGREKRQFVAIYRRHVFKYSYFWQDMRAMYPKSPAKRRWGTHRASILPPRGVFAVRSPQIMHGAQILPPSDGLGPCAGAPTPPSASPMPHTLPLRKNEAAKLAKNFAKRVILTPQTRFRRPSGEICSKRAPRLLLSTRFEYVSRSSWQRPANSAYVWAKSRPIGAESPFEKQKCTRKSKSSPRARACGLISTIECRMPCHCGKNEPIMCPHIIGNGWLRACAGALWPQGNEGAKPSLYQ